MKHQAADAILRLRSGRGDTKTLEDQMPVTKRLDQGPTKNENLGDKSNEEDSDNQHDVTDSTNLYV